MRPTWRLPGTWPTAQLLSGRLRVWFSLTPFRVSPLAHRPNRTGPGRAPARRRSPRTTARAFLCKVRVDVEAAERLRDAYERGIVIHCFRSHRVLDPMF